MNPGSFDPFCSAHTIRELGEIQLIEQIRDWLGPVAPRSPKGMGDDCAVVRLPKDTTQILTTDSLTYLRHFDDHVTPENAGAKLIKRNLSDIAAMGGHPDAALLTLLCGENLSTEWLKAFITGIRKTCEQYKVPLVGGDISTLPDGQFSSVLCQTGHMEHPPVLRSDARSGDFIYVTGKLGGSRIRKHYAFEPRLAQGQWLAQTGLCSAMIDITDGMAKDLQTLLLQNCAAYLTLHKIPLSEDAHTCATQSGRPVLEHAFCDGEDYELLFAVKSSANTDEFEHLWQQRFPKVPLTCIGHIGTRLGTAPYLDADTKEALPWVKAFEHLTGQ